MTAVESKEHRDQKNASGRKAGVFFYRRKNFSPWRRDLSGRDMLYISEETMEKR